MKYQIYINGAEIKTTPKDINTLKSKFLRDEDLPGVFVEEILEVTFLNDGYCKLKEIQETLQICEFPILFYQICKGVPKLIFDGLADTFTIQLNHEQRQAKVNIKDNSRLSRLIQNKEVVYYPTSETALDGSTITPVPIRTIDFRDADNTSPTTDWEDIEVYEAMEMLQGVTDWITGGQLTIASDFFNQEYVTEIVPGFFGANANNYRRVWEIVYATPPTINAVTTIRFKDFYGVETTFVITGIGSAGTHVENVWASLLPVFPISSLGDKIAFTYSYDYRRFDYGTDNGVDTVILRSFFDNQILSMTCDESAVSVSLSTDPDLQYIDSGNNTCFLTGKMLRKEGSDNFNYTFKWLIEELNKVYNITFLVQNNTLRIENAQTFQTGSIILTFDNVKNLTINSSLDNLYSKITTGDKGQLVGSVIERSFVSNFCGITKSFDAETDSIRSWRDIWVDIGTPTEDNDDKIYMVQGQSNEPTETMTITQPSVILTSNIVLDNDDHAYMLNEQLINNRQVIRHFPKFIGDLTVSPFETVVNDDPAQMVFDISFETVLRESDYRLLINNNLDDVKFKATDSDYYIGRVQEVDYDYASGVGRFVVSGRKFE